jgi:hypothetical protein
MTPKEAAAVIQAISQSLVSQPGQFTIQVNTTGQHNVFQGGGKFQVTAIGGGAGSRTVGQKVSAQIGTIEIQQGTRAFDTELQALVETLNKIANELDAPSPDSGKIHSLYKSLLDTWVPGVITSVIGNVLQAALGL